MIHVGIVGAEEAKFTLEGARTAQSLIYAILRAAIALHGDVVVVSGGCHLGGADIWAEEAARGLGLRYIVHLPKERSWTLGYKPRNLLIARDSDELHNITVARWADAFAGRKFPVCYHCAKREHDTGQRVAAHVKSGGCWTAREAEKLGKRATWHVIPNQEG